MARMGILLERDMHSSMDWSLSFLRLVFVTLLKELTVLRYTFVSMRTILSLQVQLVVVSIDLHQLKE